MLERKYLSRTLIAAGITTIGIMLAQCLHHPAHAAETATQPCAGGQASADHYSALTQINRKNVHLLREAWSFDTGQGEDSGMETNPIVVGRMLYAYTATQKVIALDAATGKLLWKFDSRINTRQPIRGLAYWSDGHECRILASVLTFLYALDPATGKPIPTFGERGRIDLRKGLRGDYLKQSLTVTSPGVVYGDLIILGAREPETPPAPPGDIRAFDVRTGELRWRVHTIPQPGEPGYETWPPEAWKTAGSANNWAGMTLDNKRGILYVPTGSAVPDFYGGGRIGDDLYADCLLALDAKTGKLLWHFQGVHHDIWDRDFPSAPVLLTIHHNGKLQDVVAQTTKQGFVFVLDRDTGKPVFPIQEKPFAPSTVPGEQASKTQPIPLLPAPFARQVLTENDLTDRTPQAHAYALQKVKSFVNGGLFYPLRIGKQTIVFPGFDGGAEWGGPAVDREHGILYVNANDIAWTGGLETVDLHSGLGKHTYMMECAMCHQSDLKGSPPDFPDLTSTKLSAAQVADTIHKGKGRMPAFPNLQGSELEALLRFVLLRKDDVPLSQTLYSANPGNWYVAAQIPYDSSDAVKSYPGNEQLYNGEKLDNFHNFYSSFTESSDQSTNDSVDIGFDIYFNGGWNNEVMIQNDIVNRGGQCGPVLATETFGGTNGVPVNTWVLCVYGSETIWQIQQPSGNPQTFGFQSGSVDLLAMLKWLENNTTPDTGKTYLPAGSTMYDVSYGFEICYTNSVLDNFTVSSFSITQN